MKIRTAALILTLLMLVVTVGCAGGESGSDTTAPAAATSQAEVTLGEVIPEFVEADYGNSEFVVYSRSSTAASYPGFYIDSDNVIDTMSEAVFNRNSAVEEKYKIIIKTLETSNPYETVRTDITSGDVGYDIILDRRSYLGSLAQEGHFYNFLDLENVDYSRNYWDSNAAEGYEIAGKLFFMANDVSVSNLAGARFFYFNKQLVNDYNLGNPYDLVKDNKWTLERFLGMVSSVSTENGDGIWDGQDTYGLLVEEGSGNGNIMHLLVGCGIRNTDKNSDGTLTTNAYSEKTQTIMTNVSNALRNNNNTITYAVAAGGADTTGHANIYDYGRSLFAGDHFLMIQGNMAIAEQFKNMKSDYGVLPNPKYDENQENYYHKMDKYSLIWAIPNCNMDYDRLGVIMEYWSYQSSKTVMPAFYEVTIKTKRVQEETASNILDLVKASIMYDLSEPYNTDVVSVLHAGYNSGNLSSTWAANKKIIDKKLADLYDKIKELD